MDKKSIGFIGAGNMASALIKGLITSGLYNEDQIKASDNNREKVVAVSEQYGVEAFSANTEIVRSCQIVVLAVKPQVLRGVLQEIKEVIDEKQLVISIAAGITIKMITSVLGNDVMITTPLTEIEVK